MGGLQHAGPGWKGTYDQCYHIYFIPGQNMLKDAVAFAYRRSFSHRPANSQRVMESGSVHSSSSGSETMNSDSDGSNDDDMEIANGGNNNSSLQLGRLWSQILFQMRECYNDCVFRISHSSLSKLPAGSIYRGWNDMDSSPETATFALWHGIAILYRINLFQF